MNWTVKSVNELPEIAQKILAHITFKIIIFEGEMGAGKTTLIKELILQMGSSDHTSSPSFSIVNEYETAKGKVYHFDFYRMKTEEEALDFGLDEYLNSEAYNFMEWPEKIQSYLPEDYHTVKINSENGFRTINFV